MFDQIKNHPFAVEAVFERSLVLTFAVPRHQLEAFIPSCLALDTFEDKWAFMALALVQTKHLRPKGFPKFLGNNFVLAGYRIFVRYINAGGKNLRGLYILKSETDKKKMELLGNIFTHYKYSTTDIQVEKMLHTEKISSRKSKFNIVLNTMAGEISLPAQSPFTTWKEARRFAGPLPFTFSYDAKRGEVLIIEGVRENWTPRPVHVTSFEFESLNNLGLSGMVLANAFSISDIPYHWKKGKIEKWPHKDENSRAL